MLLLHFPRTSEGATMALYLVYIYYCYKTTTIYNTKIIHNSFLATYLAVYNSNVGITFILEC